MFCAREEKALSDRGIEEDVFLLIREFEDVLHRIDRGRGLLHEELEGRVRDDRFPMFVVDEVFDVLSDRRDPEMVFSGTLHEAVEEFPAVFVLHDIPRFIDDEHTFPVGGSHDIPYIGEDDVHGDRAELFIKISYRVDLKPFSERDVGRLGEKSTKDTADVFLQTLTDTLSAFHRFDDREEVGHDRYFFAGDIVILERDAFEAIGCDDSLFQERFLCRRHVSEHELEQADEIDDTATEEIPWMALVILEGERQIERVDALRRVDADIEIASSDGIDQRFVFVFGIDDDDIMAEHEAAEYLELHGKGFTSSGLREDDHVRVFCSEPVVDDEGIIVRIDAVEYSIVL